MSHNNQGFILLITTMVISSVMILAFYFIDFAMTDVKISQGQKLASETYYLAEAGIHDAIWQLNNNPAWQSEFKNNPAWQTTFTRNNPFGDENSYEVTIQNTDLGEASISSPAVFNAGEIQGQRLIKTKIFQSLNASSTQGATIFTDQDIDFWGADFSISGGGLFANDDINLSVWSNITSAGDVMAADRIDIAWSSDINAPNLYAVNYPPAPDPVEMPQIDFDSADLNSYLSRADQVYSENEFDDLLDDNNPLIVNGITYVQGNVDVERGNNLVVNGLLVADGNIKIGSNGWPIWKARPELTVNSTSGQPAGLITKRDIDVGIFAGEVSINGLLYANDSIVIRALGVSFQVTGGIICRRFNGFDFWSPQTLILDQAVIDITLNPGASPIINIEHWEEEY